MEENSSILINLCSQKYFKDIFARSSNSLAFTSSSLDIIWANNAFKKITGGGTSLAEFKPDTMKYSPFIRQMALKNAPGSLIFFPIIFQEQFLGYLVLFNQNTNNNDSYELNAAKHDLNNLLTLVLNLIYDADKPALANTGLKMTKEFLDNFSLNRQLPDELLDINNTLNFILQPFAESSTSSIIFKSNIPDDLYKVRINKTRFIRIISNLIKNAAEAIPAKGKVTLSASNLLKGDRGFVCITIEDTGKGIPEREIKNIFNKDYSTKMRGSGLGLSIVKKLLDESNASIEVKSREGSGTQFIVKFPASAGISKAIALIEDEKAINELLTDLLSAQYSVSSYLDGESFLAGKNINAFDLIIIDKKLPGIDGIECIKKIRAVSGTVKIILASGSEMEGKKKLSLPAIDRIINKPYKFDQLLSLVEELLA